MPNHITNRLTIVSTDNDRIREILEAIQDDERGIGSVDFEKIIPMPEGIYRGDVGQREVQLYGKNTALDFAVENWGTKWNSYGYDDFPPYENGSEIMFLTAWNRPEPVIVKLSEKFPDVEFQHQWADEDIGHNVGTILYENGQEIERDVPAHYSKEAYEMASDIQGLELSEFNLYYNTELGNYRYVPDEELFAEHQRQMAEEGETIDELHTSPDFQCDQTGGYPTVLVWNQENGTAILQPAPAYDNDSAEAGQCIRDCADWGVQPCDSWEDYNELLESLGEDAAQNVVDIDDEDEEFGMGGLQ